LLLLLLQPYSCFVSCTAADAARHKLSCKLTLLHLAWRWRACAA
jgi:hypothetical protein